MPKQEGFNDDLLEESMDLQQQDPGSDPPELEGPVDIDDDPSDLLPDFPGSGEPDEKTP